MSSDRNGPAPMTVLELCLSPDLGGLELYMARSARALATTDRVIAVAAAGGRLQERLAAEGIDTRFERAAFRPLPLRAARRLARLIDREGVDVVHVHWGKDLPLAALAKRLSRRRLRLVYTRQMQITRPKRDFYHNFLYGQVDRLIAITRALAEATRGFLDPRYAGRVTYLYYGTRPPAAALDAEQRRAGRAELGAEDDTFLVGLIGRVTRAKGQHLLVEAVGEAKRQGRAVAALIVGGTMEDSDYLPELKRRCEELEINDRVTFRDFTDDPQGLMQLCDVVALATWEETFGLVLIEAMRCNVAVVGSDRGGVPEIIDDGETGLLFTSGEWESLAKALFTLQDDPALRARLAEAGREKADRMFDEAGHYQRLRVLLAGGKP